jgi:hypothetical protein
MHIVCVETVSKQTLMFRLAQRDHGITQKMIHMDTGIGLSTLGQYVRGESVMSLAAVRKLARMKEFPSALLSVLFDDTERHVVDGDGDSDLDSLGEDADAVAAAVRRARHPNSPGGIEITQDEEASIRCKVVQFRGRLNAA